VYAEFKCHALYFNLRIVAKDKELTSLLAKDEDFG
jgi:hypothetical protein